MSNKFFQPVVIIFDPKTDPIPSILDALSLTKDESLIEIITPETTQTISVDQIREMIQDSSLKDILGKVRVYAFTDADKMKDVAQNSLLKILEEPPEDIAIVLLASKKEGILHTVLSRCRLVRLASDAEIVDDLEKVLKEVVFGETDRDLRSTQLQDLDEQSLRVETLVGMVKNNVDHVKLAKLKLFSLWVRK